MSDEKNEPPSVTSDHPPSRSDAGVAAPVIPSAADAFSDTKVNTARWLKATRSGPLRVLSPDEVLSLGAKIAGDQKLVERLVGVLSHLLPTNAPDGTSAAILEIAECVLRQRVPEMFGQEPSSGVEQVLNALNRLRREMKPGPEQHVWLEAIVRTALLSRAVDPFEIPLLARTAFGATPKAPKSGKKKARSTSAAEIVLDEETAFLLTCLGKPPVLSASLAIASIYRRRMGTVEDSLARLEAQVAQAQRVRERLEMELAARSDTVNARDAEIAKLRDDARRQQASWDARLTEGLHQVETLRGRMLGVLRGDLSLWLETARDAATASPPRIGVITERLERALERAAKEAEWLKSSDWT